MHACLRVCMYVWMDVVTTKEAFENCYKYENSHHTTYSNIGREIIVKAPRIAIYAQVIFSDKNVVVRCQLSQVICYFKRIDCSSMQMC
jgi:hypothetical protein